MDCLISSHLSLPLSLDDRTRVLSRPLESELPRIYQELGTDFDDRVLPSLGNEVRTYGRMPDKTHLRACVQVRRALISNGSSEETGWVGGWVALAWILFGRTCVGRLCRRGRDCLVGGPTTCSFGHDNADLCWNPLFCVGVGAFELASFDEASPFLFLAFQLLSRHSEST